MAAPTGINLFRYDLTTLRLFTAAVDHGSLTASAERIGISLPAASKRMAELEAHLGVAVLSRSKHGVKPTQAGHTLYRHAVTLVAGLEQLSVAMSDFTRGASEHLRLWANTSAFSGFLAPLLAEYCKRYPSVVLDLEDVLSEDAPAAVADGHAELAIVGANTPIGSLESMVCHIDELVAIVPQGHPLDRGETAALAECLDYDLIALARATSLMRQISAMADARGSLLKIRAQVRNFDAMCRFVSLGLGIAVLPRLGALPHLSTFGLSIVRFRDIDTERRLLLIMKSRQHLSQAAEHLVNLAGARLVAA